MQKTITLALQEAHKVFEPFAFIENLPPDQQKNLWGALLLDMAYIASRLGHPSEGLSRVEIVIAALFLRYPFLSKQEQHRYQHWDSLDDDLVGEIEPHVQALFGAIDRKNDRGLRTPRHFRELEATNGSVGFYDRYTHALFRFAQVIAKADGVVDENEEVELRRVWEALSGEGCRPELCEIIPETSSDIVARIDAMVGLDSVKARFRALAERGVLPRVGNAFAFLGPPGTGKSSVVHLLGRLMRAQGALERGHVIEVGYSELMGDEPKDSVRLVTEAFRDARGGVLFVDEATGFFDPRMPEDAAERTTRVRLQHAIVGADGGVITVLSGSTEQCRQFIERNPAIGYLRANIFEFEHYQPKELEQIFCGLCESAQYLLSPMAAGYIHELCTRLHDELGASFGNGRLMRTIFDRALERHAHRITSRVPLTHEMLSTIEIDDLPLVPTKFGVRSKAA